MLDYYLRVASKLMIVTGKDRPLCWTRVGVNISTQENERTQPDEEEMKLMMVSGKDRPVRDGRHCRKLNLTNNLPRIPGFPSPLHLSIFVASVYCVY